MSRLGGAGEVRIACCYCAADHETELLAEQVSDLTSMMVGTGGDQASHEVDSEDAEPVDSAVYSASAAVSAAASEVPAVLSALEG